MVFNNVEQPAPGLPKTTVSLPGLIMASIDFKISKYFESSGFFNLLIASVVNFQSALVTVG